jgi:Transglutaminase-like superfamily
MSPSAPARALHWLARAALRLQGPAGAKRTVDRVGCWLPPYRTVADAQRDALALGASGSCLSRALAVASRTAGAEVVIGVNPRVAAKLYAHAWVEVDETCIEGSSDRGLVEEIARLTT